MTVRFILSERQGKPGVFTMDMIASDYEAIGRFISACSLIEVTMHLVLREWLEVEDRVARGLIGEPRSNDLIDFLKFAFGLKTPLPDKQSVDCLTWIYEQCAYVNALRSVVAHKPCLSDGSSLMFHNYVTAKKETSEFRYICTSAQIGNAASHAMNVALCLRGSIVTAPRSPAQYWKDCDEIRASSEKLDLPKPPHQANQPTAKPKRQRRSSPLKPE